MADSTTRVSLTSRQNEIYEYIRNCIQQNSTPPTIPEIGAHFGMRSTNGVNDALNVLERKGYIIRIKGIARGIALPKNAPSGSAASRGVKRIPIVGEGESLNPLSVFMNPSGMFTPDPTIFPTTNSFAAIVADDGMDREGIVKGDYVIVQQTADLADGALVFALVGSQQLVRRLQGTGERRHLISVNRYYAKIAVITGQDDVALLGEVVGVVRALGRG